MKILRYTAAIVLLVVMALPAVSYPQEQDLDDRIFQKEKDLDKLRREIAEQRKKIKEVEKKERDVSGYLKKLEREERLTRELLAGLEEKEQMLTLQVEELRRDLENNEKIYTHRLGVLTERLRDMYKGRTSYEWQELLDASDFTDLLQRYKFLTIVAERDASLVEDVKQRRVEIEKQEAAITELLHEASVSRREKEDELQKLQDNEEERKKTLTSLHADKQKYQKAASDLEKAEKDLQNLIDVLEKQRVEQAKDWGDYGERDFSKLKGKLPAPADGRIVRSFGRFKHPEYGTVTFNTGVDIGAGRGSPVKAVARGRVEYSSVLPGYGNCIIINHGGGYYTLYAHTSRIFVKQGEQIERGKVIAEAGEGGPGAESPLHFEIRKSKKALDPAEWMGR